MWPHPQPSPVLGLRYPVVQLPTWVGLREAWAVISTVLGPRHGWAVTGAFLGPCSLKGAPVTSADRVSAAQGCEGPMPTHDRLSQMENTCSFPHMCSSGERNVGIAQNHGRSHRTESPPSVFWPFPADLYLPT